MSAMIALFAAAFFDLGFFGLLLPWYRERSGDHVPSLVRGVLDDNSVLAYAFTSSPDAGDGVNDGSMMFTLDERLAERDTCAHTSLVRERFV